VRFGLSRVILNVAAFQFDRWGDVEFVEMEQAVERG